MRLVIFDVDGTLVDSQDDICAAMDIAFDSLGQSTRERQAIKAIVGLSLPEAMHQLAPEMPEQHSGLIEAYKGAYMRLRSQRGTAQSSPMFEGARATLDVLRDQDETLLAVATGKSGRGLQKLIEGHKLEGYFHSQQVADHHPSKPHPAMILAALAETGVDANQAVMIGDTSFDMDMARAAGVRSIAVGWGYHAPDTLKADAHVQNYAALPSTIDKLLGEPR